MVVDEGIMDMSGQSVGKTQTDVVSDCAPCDGDSPKENSLSKVGPTVNKGSMLDMVVEEGVLDQHKPDLGEVIVVAEDIPSWLLLLSGATHGSLACVCARGKNNWFVRDSGLEAGCSYLEFSNLDSWFLKTKGQRRTILVQTSSRAFSLQVLELANKSFLAGKDSLVIASSVRFKLTKLTNTWNLKWQRVSHSAVGGVSSDKFCLGSVSRDPKQTNPAPFRMSSVQRFVRGIQKVDVSGKTCPAPGEVVSSGDFSSSTGAGLHDPNVHVTSGCLLEPFRLMSVFDTTTGWVGRKLTGREVASAWDVPPDRIKRLESDLAVGHTTLRQLLSSPPLKVLQGAFGLFQPEGNVSDVPEFVEQVDPGDTSFKLSTYVPDVILKELSASHVKAVKNDDAATETAMWDTACVPNFIPEVHLPAFEHLRAFSVKRFVRNVKSSFGRYLLQRYNYTWKDGDTGGDTTDGELRRDLEAGLDGIRRAEQSSFWNWDGGSTPFFWRWQPEVQADMRDGTKLYVDKSKLPTFKKAQKLPRDKNIVERITEKIHKVRLRGYIAAGLVLSLTSFFHVPKGEDDIRLVYDLTACGLNDALWAPSFWMPTIMNVLDCATSDAWFGDVDAGEMFLNYILDVSIRPYAGVDISWLNAAGGTVARTWERWTRMAMGMTPSPFVTIRLFAWAMEIIKGDRRNKDNPFYWSEVKLNCPGSPDYDPSMPRVYKWNDILGCIAADCVTFVDDLRTIGFTRSLVQRATHRVETIMGYLGLQDATRKRRPNSRNPGEWTGSKSVSIPGTGLFVTVSQKKWDKARGIIAELLEHFSDSKSLPKLDLKDLERKVGFLVHLAMAYPLMLPFLRGFYLTMNSWRVGRDAVGWKLPAGAYAAMMAEMRGAGTWSAPSFKNTRGPPFVTASPLLFGQLTALSKLFESPEPTLRLIRGASIYEACYVFGDASGEGFGSSWLDKKGTISFRYGIWGVEGEGSSSNYRELRNLVETLERLGELGELVGREVFLFTDNAVSESVAAKGSSASPKLYELVVRLYRLEMKYLCKLEMIHVAGTRMIEQGTDGLSRGDMYEGVMAGDSMLTHVPLHLSALERSSKLENWISSWALTGSDQKLEVLSPSDWFERGHDFWGSRTNIDGYWMPAYKPGVFLWAPPPGAARIAIEQLRQARLKRQKSMHIFVVPRLMITEWRRQVLKGSDFRFELPVGHPVWSVAMHEPLMIALCFPYLSRQPWELRKTDLMVDLGGEVQRVLKKDPAAGWNILSQLCNLTREMDAMSLLRLRRVLRGRWRPEVSSEPSL